MEFIGQEKLIKDLTETKARSILVHGQAHTGKKSLIRAVFSNQGLYVYEVSGTINDFRETIEFIRTQTNPIMYLIPDVDRLHPGVQNLLLKILEEPPMRARFCLTASNSILPTIKSRCVCYPMESYTPEQIISTLCDSERNQFNQSAESVRNSIISPGQAHLLYGWGKGDVVLTMIEKMSDLLAAADSLALILNRANELAKYMRENSVDYYTFYLLARGLYSEFESFQILSQSLNDLDRYIMCYFYAALWKEVACR